MFYIFSILVLNDRYTNKTDRSRVLSALENGFRLLLFSFILGITIKCVCKQITISMYKILGRFFKIVIEYKVNCENRFDMQTTNRETIISSKSSFNSFRCIITTYTVKTITLRYSCDYYIQRTSNYVGKHRFVQNQSYILGTIQIATEW